MPITAVRPGFLQMSPEQSENNEDQDDDQQHVNEVAAPWQPRYASRSKVSQQPKDEQDNNQNFEHSASSRVVSMFGVLSVLNVRNVLTLGPGEYYATAST